VRLVAFLRAINVGGHTVAMEALRREFAALGLDDVETFIASGNVIFSATAGALPSLERKIEARLLASFGYDVKTFLRTADEVGAIARHRAFPEARLRDAGAFCVGFVAEPLRPAARRSLAALRSDVDDFHVHGREVYWLCKLRQSESKFSNVRLEKALGISSTFRGVPTIVKLAAKQGW